MIHNMVGGGAALNFKIVGNPQPENPEENTLWVDTDEEITSWAFSATHPPRVSLNKNLLCRGFVQEQELPQYTFYQDNHDGTVSFHGQPSETVIFHLINPDLDTDKGLLYLSEGTYTLSGTEGPAGASIRCTDADGNILAEATGSASKTFRIYAPQSVYCYIRILPLLLSGNRLTFRPQLERGSVATDFVQGDAAGLVWVQTDSSGSVSFNALKRNCVMVYPNDVKQYIPSQGWVDKTAKLYIGGEWVDM